MTINVRASTLASRVQGELPTRWSGFAANPVGTIRVTKPSTLVLDSPPTVLHPKLNTKPWSTSYAVKRQPMSKRKSKKVRKG